MSAKRSKQIKRIIGLSEDRNNPLLRRVYRRIKKQYSKLPSSQRTFFLDNLQDYAIMDTYE